MLSKETDMDELVIERFCYAEDGTFGRYSLGGYHWFTIEQPWNNNMAGASCIPEGSYICKPDFFHRGNYKSVEITDVPGGRSRILFHKANWPHQLRGCIAPVSEWGCVGDMVGGPNSKRAFDFFMAELGSKVFKLKVTRTDLLKQGAFTHG